MRVVGLLLAAATAIVLLVAATFGAPAPCGPAAPAGDGGELVDGRGGEKVIPAEHARVYRQVAAQTGVPAAILAAVGYVETKHGRIGGPSTAGALGPMQFLPSTWAGLGCDGSIHDLQPAVRCSAKYLISLAKEPGARRAPDRWIYAMCRYNGGCTNGIRAEAGYGAAGEVAGQIAREYGYRPGTSDPDGLRLADASTSATACPAATSTDGAPDVTTVVTPWVGKTWGGALAAGMQSLGWPAGTPWCQIFTQNVLAKLGIDRPTPRSAHSSDPYYWATTQNWGQLLHGPGKPASASLQLRPADIVMYGPAGRGSAHVNLVERVDERGVITVGGNQGGCPGGACVSRRGPVRLTGSGGSLRWSSGDTRPIWAIVRPPAPGGGGRRA
jgi:hypothetical protein